MTIRASVSALACACSLSAWAATTDDLVASVNAFLASHQRKPEADLPVEYACQNLQESESDEVRVEAGSISVVKRVAWVDPCPEGKGGSGVDVETYVARLADIASSPYFSAVGVLYNVQLNCRIANCFSHSVAKTWTDRTNAKGSDRSDDRAQFVALSTSVRSRDDPVLADFRRDLTDLLSGAR